jgi:regulator of sirC expression with transglutaminase-like and TPR domain
MIRDPRVRSDPALAAFAAEVRRSEDDIDLGRAMLQMARFVYPRLDVDAYCGRLDAIAAQARSALGASLTPAALAAHLFTSAGAGFLGNTREYADPRNSYLNDLLDRRLGLPITLSVLFIETARRLGMRAAGVGLPGHFIAQAWEGDAVVRLDPFHGGRVLTIDDCYELAAATARIANFEPEWMQPVGVRYILTRVLNNLRNRGPTVLGVHGMIGVLERQLVLEPERNDTAALLGLLCSTAGQRQRAVDLLDQALQGELDDELRERATSTLQAKLQEIAARN